MYKPVMDTDAFVDRVLMQIFFHFSCRRVGRAWRRSRRGACGVQNPHEDVSIDDGLHGLCEHRQSVIVKPGLVSMPLGVQGDDRNLRHTCLLQGSADKADVVGGTAAAAGLAHERQPSYLKSYLPDSSASMICPMTIRDG